jgi:hypothetical protein
MSKYYRWRKVPAMFLSSGPILSGEADDPFLTCGRAKVVRGWGLAHGFKYPSIAAQPNLKLTCNADE